MKKIFAAVFVVIILTAHPDLSSASGSRVYVSVSLAGGAGVLFWFISYSAEVSKKDEEVRTSLLSSKEKAGGEDSVSSIEEYNGPEFILPIYRLWF